MTGKELIKRYKSCLKGFEDVGSTDILEEMIDNALIEARTEPVSKLHCSGGLSRIAELEDELRVTDSLLSERQRVLEAIPACEAHGPCVPHALEWIEEAKKRTAA